MTSEWVSMRKARLGYALRTAILMLLVFVTSVLAAGSAVERNEERGWTGFIGGMSEVLTFITIIAALVSPFVVIFRARHRVKVTWILGLLQLVFPLGPIMAFVLPRTMRDGDRAQPRQLSALYVAGLTVWFVRDALGPTAGSSLIRYFSVSGTTVAGPVDFPVIGAVAAYLVLAITPIAVGHLRRARSELDDTRHEADEQRATAGELTAQLSRQAERELIAREVHDVLGHRLSLLSLHAGGLEVASAQQPQLQEHARFVRESAQHAMDDLRSLVGVLREPGAAQGGSLDPSVSSLEDLERVIDDAAESGVSIASSVFIAEASQAEPVLAHAVYRIVQELLTNARKHAVGHTLRLKVNGGPGEGVQIEASNPVPAGVDPGDGSGLAGVRERVGLLGGQMEVPPEDGRFVVRVSLPWRRDET